MMNRVRLCSSLLVVVWLLPAFKTLKAQIITVGDSIVHCRNNEKNGAIYLTLSGGDGSYRLIWSTGDSTASILGIDAGDYVVTVSDTSGDTANAVLSVGYETIWDTLKNMYMDISGKLSSTNGQNLSNNSYAVGLNTLNTSNSGWVSFIIDAGDTFNGFLGLYDNIYLDESSRFIGVQIVDEDINIVGDAIGDATFFGNYTPGSGYKISVKVTGDSAYFAKSNIDGSELTVTSFPYSRLTTMMPLILANLDNSKIANVVSSFACYNIRADIAINSTSIFCNVDTFQAVNIRGGFPPYRFKWSSGDTNATCYLSRFGDYTLTISDAVGDSVIKTAFAGNYVTWDVLNQVRENEHHGLEGDRSILTGNLGYGFGLNRLDPDSDGKIDFNFTYAGHYGGLIGLTTDLNYLDGDPDGIYVVIVNDTLGSILPVPKGIYVLSPGEGTYLGEVQDSVPLKIRIQKHQDSVRIIKNDIGEVDLIVTNNVPLYPAFVPFWNGTITDKVICDFRAHPRIFGEVANINCGNSTLGGINSYIKGGCPPFTMHWSNGDSSTAITNLNPGAYAVTAVDAAGDTAIGNFNIDYKVLWDSLAFVEVKQDSSLGPILPVPEEDSPAFGYGANTLYVGLGETGKIDFRIAKGSGYQGYLGVSNNVSLETTMKELIVFVNNTDLYLVSDDEYLNNTYLGQLNPLLDNNFQLQIIGKDTIVYKLNDQVLFATHYKLPPYVRPLAQFMFRDNGSIKSVSSSFCHIERDTSAHAGSLASTSDTLCSGLTDTLISSGYSGNIIWQKSDSAGFWSTMPVADGLDTVTESSNSNNWYRIVATKDGRYSDTSNVVQVNFTSLKSTVNGGIQVSTEICSYSDTISLKSDSSQPTGLLYNWEHSANGSDFSKIDGADALDYQLSDPHIQTGWFRRKVIRPKYCLVNSNIIKIQK